MDLPDPKKLDALIKLCRKRGVTEMQLGDLRLTLGERPPRGKDRVSPDVGLSEMFPEDDTDLSFDERLFYSVPDKAVIKPEGEDGG